MNVGRFYIKAQEFQDKRDAINQEYSDTMQKIKNTRGSEYYTEASRKARDKKAAALSALKAEYAPVFNSILDSMESVNESRPMAAPSQEELNVVTMMRMKEAPTENELITAANAVKGNPTALSIINEIARKNGVLRNFASLNTERSIAYINDVISSLRAGVSDFMEHDTQRAARLYAQHRERMYNDGDIELPARANFSDPDGCFAEIGGMDAATVSALEAAVG